MRDRDDRSGARPPLQARSRASLERLLDATESLLESKYFHELTVEEIVAAADSSIGSFYGRFASKDALIVALADRYRRDVESLWRGSEGGLSLAERVDRVARERVGRYRRRRGLLRGLGMHVRLHPESRDLIAPVQARSAARRAERFILESSEEIRHAHPALAVRLGVYAMSAACRERMLFEAPHAASVRVSDARLARELGAMVTAYLTTP